MEKEFSVVSLFCGAGGLDMGFHNKGFKILWSNDFDKDACKTHELWSKSKVVCGDIKKIDFDEIPYSDVILGGFPCQGFSLAGPRKIDDSRNTLYKSFVKLVDEKKPKMFVAENVKGLLSMGDGAIFEAIIKDFEDKGYKVFYQLFNTKDYEVPQDRQRVIIVGIRNDLNYDNFKFPEKSNKKVFLKDIAINKGIDMKDVCTEPYSSRYMSRNRKRTFEDVSFTIPAMAKQVPLHPSSPNMKKLEADKWEFGEGVTRRLSYKECALIQTFPKNMTFVGNLTSKYKQIGNAVPIRFAEFIAESVKNFLESE